MALGGGESLVPVLDVTSPRRGEAGVKDVVLGMAQRGRLNVLIKTLGKSPRKLFDEFEGKFEHAADDGRAHTGDVKYHVGATGTYHTESGKVILVRLLPNPSHLEAIDPVVEGWSRAVQTQRRATSLHLDPLRAPPFLVPGAAAFAGQGAVRGGMG